MFRFSTSVVMLLVGARALAADPTGWTPSAAEADLIQALSSRDASPPCAELEAKLPTPASSLQALVEHVTMPPWVGMRAAGCLISGHALEARPALENWVVDPELHGLAILVLGQLDTLPTEVATGVATLAIEKGADPADARRRVARSTRPEIASLATSLPASTPVAQ